MYGEPLPGKVWFEAHWGPLIPIDSHWVPWPFAMGVKEKLAKVGFSMLL